MTIDEIRELIQLVTETGVAELEVERAGERVRIRRSFGAFGTDETRSHEIHLSAPAPATPAPAATEPTRAKADSSLVYVKNPIVGTFYEAASPESEPFVRIGDHVSPGKVLCIVESMKLMNEIEADVAGVIETKLVENGQAVEYGEALFGIRPV